MKTLIKLRCALLAAALLLTAATAQAGAQVGTVVGKSTDKDGNVHTFIEFKDHFEERWSDKRGDHVKVTPKKGDSNPNPEDPSSGPKGDLGSAMGRAKQKGGGKFVEEQNFWKSPGGKSLGSKGKGPNPVINPSDEGGGGGTGSPGAGAQNLGKPHIINKGGPIGAGKGGGFQFNSGSPADQLKKPGGPAGQPGGGGSGGGDDNDGSHHKPPPGSNFGPAELVDPLGPPISFDKKKINKSQQAPAGTKAQGTKAGSSSRKPVAGARAGKRDQNKDKVGDQIEPPR